MRRTSAAGIASLFLIGLISPAASQAHMEMEGRMAADPAVGVEPPLELRPLPVEPPIARPEAVNFSGMILDLEIEPDSAATRRALELGSGRPMAFPAEPEPEAKPGEEN